MAFQEYDSLPANDRRLIPELVLDNKSMNDINVPSYGVSHLSPVIGDKLIMTTTSNHGILFALFNVSNTSASDKNIVSTLHAEDELQKSLATTGLPAGCFYGAIEQTAGHPWLALFPIPDLTILETDKLTPTRVERELLPGGETHGMKSHDIRYYQYLDTWEIPTTKEGEGILDLCFTSVFLRYGD
jgi:hypothetical protein